MPWSKRAVRTSEKRRILLATSEFSADLGPTAISLLPPTTVPSAAVAKQRGQLPQPLAQQPPSSSGKTAPVFLCHYCQYHHQRGIYPDPAL